MMEYESFLRFTIMLTLTQDDEWDDDDPLESAEVGEFDFLSCTFDPSR